MHSSTRRERSAGASQIPTGFADCGAESFDVTEVQVWLPTAMRQPPGSQQRSLQVRRATGAGAGEKE